MSLYWISLPYATFGLIADATVRRAAPIAGWSVGKQTDYVLAYFRRKGAMIEVVK